MNKTGQTDRTNRTAINDTKDGYHRTDQSARGAANGAPYPLAYRRPAARTRRTGVADPCAGLLGRSGQGRGAAEKGGRDQILDHRLRCDRLGDGRAAPAARIHPRGGIGPRGARRAIRPGTGDDRGARNAQHAGRRRGPARSWKSTPARAAPKASTGLRC